MPKNKNQWYPCFSRGVTLQKLTVVSVPWPVLNNPKSYVAIIRILLYPNDKQCDCEGVDDVESEHSDED